jgi:hypothetical protein
MWFSLIGGVLLFAHINVISEYEHSGEGPSDSTLTRDRSACLVFLINVVDFSIGLFFSDFSYILSWVSLRFI